MRVEAATCDRGSAVRSAMMRSLMTVSMVCDWRAEECTVGERG
jgi:hypothetical protein